MNCLFKVVVACLVVCLIGFCAKAVARGSSKNLEAARRGVDNFHARYNAMQFQAVHATSDPQIHTQPEKEFIGKMLACRRKLGTFISCAEEGMRFENGPNGRLVFLSYRSRYYRGEAVEYFVFRVRNGKAVLSDFSVMSDLFVY